MSNFIRIIGDNPNYVPEGYYTGIFNQAYAHAKLNKRGVLQQHLYLEFAVPVPGVSQLRTVKKHYTLPSNRIEADLRNYFGEDFIGLMNGRDLDLEAINSYRGRCADIEVTTYQGPGYSVPHSSVKEFHPCGTFDNPEREDEIIED